MSQHRSFQIRGGASTKRNVLKRSERMKLLRKRGQWTKESRIVGMPKTKPEA